MCTVEQKICHSKRPGRKKGINTRTSVWKMLSLSPLAAFSAVLLPGTNQRVSQAGRNNVPDKKEADHISVCQ